MVQGVDCGYGSEESLIPRGGNRGPAADDDLDDDDDDDDQCPLDEGMGDQMELVEAGEVERLTRRRRAEMRRANIRTGTTIVLIFIGVVFALIGMASIGRHRHSALPATYIDTQQVVANTTCGPVSGRIQDHVYTFKGIPYAQPPVGNLRWHSPKPLTRYEGCWSGVYSANDFPYFCTQHDPREHRDSGSEDCLYLNVWTPYIGDNAINHCDVMVYIHGGGLLQGSGHDRGETPTPGICKATNTVYVTFNYRLNIFGFLALEELSARSHDGVSGNYGLQDIMLVLNWVRENINNFGGNPERVTIFGPDGGSGAIVALLASPYTTGLFHSAWMMSGIPHINITLRQAEAYNRDLLNSSRCESPSINDTLDCMYEKSAGELMANIDWKNHPLWANGADRSAPTELASMQGGLLVIDGNYLPLSPMDALITGRFNDVPLLVGSMAQAVDDFPSADDINTWSWPAYDAHVAKTLNVMRSNMSQKALRLYPHHISPTYELASMATDLRVTCPTNYATAILAAHLTSPVWRYVATSCPSNPIKTEHFVKEYAFSGWDALSYFGVAKYYVDSPTKKDRQFMYNLRSLVDVLTGKTELTTSIQPVPAGTIIVADMLSFIQEDYHSEMCYMWEANGLYPQHAWNM